MRSDVFIGKATSETQASDAPFAAFLFPFSEVCYTRNVQKLG